MLEFKNVAFSYKNKKVLENLSFSLKKGEILAIMGPSGCGKTTTLRIICGFENSDEGELYFK